MSDIILADDGPYSGLLGYGQQLAETPERDGGWAEYFDPGANLDIQDPMLKAETAIMLENHKRWLAEAVGRPRKDNRGRRVVNEDTVSAMVGGFSDYLFPIIRASFPNNPMHDLVSVQVTNKEHATIVYWNWIYGTQKGSVAQGQRMFDSNRGTLDSQMSYSSELIDRENVTTGDGSTGPYSFTLQYHTGGGVYPGTVAITANLASGDTTVFDDGNGGFTGGIAGSINYATGAVSGLTFGSSVPNGNQIWARYRWNSEGSPDLPEVDVQITTTTAETERRAMKLNYSTEAAQNIMSELGIQLEPQLVKGVAERINYEIARQIIADLWSLAPVVATFPIRPASGSGFNQQDHFRDIVYPLNIASDHITNETQKGYGNWIIVDSGAATVIESLPSTLFEAAPRPQNVNGVHYIGRLMGKFSVYKDIFLSSEPGASKWGNILMGFKGQNFFEAGYVFAPYRLLYMTDTVTLSDFLSQKGVASRYATKTVNSRMFARISLTAGG